MRRVIPRLRSFGGNRSGASAVEFSIVAMPFILVIMMTLQMGVFYMTQSALDSGTVQAADSLVNQFYNGTTPTIPTASTLKTLVATKAGGMIHNDTTLSVELREFSALTTASVAIGNTVDPSVAGDILALRTQARVPMFVPGFSSLAMVRSAALVRRQGY